MTLVQELCNDHARLRSAMNALAGDPHPPALAAAFVRDLIQHAHL